MAQGVRDPRRARTGGAMARFLEISGRRWALRVLWELRVGALNFRALREACGGISPSVLQRRLHEWREFGVVERIPRLGYRLTARGERLFPVLAQIDKWARG
jgi:DNA-binding HxlR family transcriptional regulator